MAKRKVNRGKFVNKTQAEKDAEQFLSGKTSEMSQKLATQMDRQQKQTLTDRDTQIGGVANLDQRLQDKVGGYDSARNLARSADIAIAQTRIAAAANNLEEKDKAQRNLAFVKGNYEDAQIKGGSMVKGANQAASMNLGEVLANDSISASKYAAMTGVATTAAKTAAKVGTGVDVDTNDGNYYDAQGNPLTRDQYALALESNGKIPVFSKDTKMVMGFSGNPKLNKIATNSGGLSSVGRGETSDGTNITGPSIGNTLEIQNSGLSTYSGRGLS